MTCTMCKGSGLDPVQPGGLTKVCRKCGGCGKVINESTK
jgi:DnaJ-class molecular chaperone